MLINSKEYWNDRFSQNWVLCGGIEQSKFFYKLLIQNLTEEITQEIKNNKLSLCDIGCAEGEGVYLLSTYFPDSYIVGQDFSATAISNAKNKFPNNHFQCSDMLSSTVKYDILVCSNVLEHFSNPYEITNKIVLQAQRYFITLVPFKEYNKGTEHFYTFEEKDIINKIPGFNLHYYKIINCLEIPDTRWHGYQLFSVFQKI
ncbi:MAG: class I SAM-dependent methyltransferase [Pelosinus sp.]|nr:class I SAM-dependent methyltransferase [Pelosinus sp.]